MARNGIKRKTKKGEKKIQIDEKKQRMPGLDKKIVSDFTDQSFGLFDCDEMD
jgi:hypothetical protein